MFLGKLLGALFGYWMADGYGAMVGFVLGYFYDKSRTPLTGYRRRVKVTPLSAAETERVRQAFFSATFSVMGHVAKADGRVVPSEIAQAQSIMDQMGLSAELRSSAIALFNKGKQAGFDLDIQLKRFRNDCASSSGLYRVFLEIQIQSALADGNMVKEEEVILLRVADVLGFPEMVYRQIEMLVRVSMRVDGQRRRQGGGSSQESSSSRSRSSGTSIHDAYAVLGVSANDDKTAVKTAYRKLMSQHHPDKLISKGLPEEMLKIATNKTQQIQVAYDQIKTAKGWK